MDTRGRASKRRRLASSAAGESSESFAVQPPPCPSLRPNKELAGASRTAPTYDTFHPFQRLPPELRLYIWREVARDATQPFHPLRLRLYRGKERVLRPTTRRGYITRDILRLTHMPDLSKATIQRRALLQVCREARTEVLKLWNSMMTLERGGIVRFSFEFDMVYLDIVNPLVVEDLVELRIKNDLPAWATVIGHVGFDMTPSMPLWLLHHESDLEPRASFIMCFPNLHSLSLVSFGAFQTEIDWSSREDSNWIISRTRSHSVYLRGFPAIEQCDYSAPCAVGKRTTGLRDKHDCAICTIHKCVYVHQFVGKKARNARLMAIPGLTAENKDWLRQLKHYTLIASTPGMIARIPAYTINTAGWWINRPEARQRLLGETGGDDEDNSESEAHGHSSDDEDENDDDGHDHHHGGFLPGDNNGDHAGHHHGDEDDDDEESDHDHDEDSDDGDFFVN